MGWRDSKTGMRLSVSFTFVLSVLECSLPATGGLIPSSSTYSVKSSHPVPAGWKRIQRAPADHQLHLRIGLKQNNFAGLQRRLYEGQSCKVQGSRRSDLQQSRTQSMLTTANTFPQSRFMTFCGLLRVPMTPFTTGSTSTVHAIETSRTPRLRTGSR